MKFEKILTRAGLFLFATAMLASCSKSADLYDQTVVDEKKEVEQQVKLDRVLAEYAANFEKKYGAIKADQSWDFTTGRTLGTRGVATITTTECPGLDFGVTDGKTVTKNNSIYNAIEKVLPESKKKTGKPAVLVCPTSSFYIFPLSNRGRWTYDLKVKVGNNEPVQLYSKTWRKFDKHYVNGMKNDGVTIDMKGLYIEAPVGTPIDIFIDNVDSNTTGPKPSVGTSTGQAIYVDVPNDVTLEVPAGVDLKDDAVIKYVGIEDNTNTQRNGNLEITDSDYNDIVLAIVGNPDVPEEVIITEDEYEVVTKISKRYMVEDLGSTDDFDFNDIVVDVEKYFYEKHKVTFENGARKSDEIVSTETSGPKAVIRAMGGTLDFTLRIGSTSWSKSGAGFDIKTMYNTTKGSIDYDKELAVFDVTGWDPDQNDISVQVEESSNGVYTITFPKAGTAPMIIAVDPTEKWMTERQSVPSSWFN